MLQVRGLVERVSERSQPAQPSRLGRTCSCQGNSEEGKQQSEPGQGGRHVRGGDENGIMRMVDNDGFQVGTISEVGYITNKLTQRLKASIFILSIEIMSDMYKHLFILKN